LRILEESIGSVFSNCSKSEVLDIEKEYTQRSDGNSETEEENEPQTCCWQPAADSYFLEKIPFIGRSGPKVNVNNILETFL